MDFATSDSSIAISRYASGLRYKWLLLVICAIALAIRFYISWHSVGTNDIETWRGFGEVIEKRGMAQAYKREYFLNHPPLPTLYTWACWKIRTMTGWRFELMIKIPAILADGALCILMYYWGCILKDAKLGIRFAILMAICPIAILVSGFHGNTDNLYVFFLLAGLIAIQRQRFLLAGILLGCSLNVKVIPVLLFPAIFFTQTSWANVRKIIYGLLITSIPFLIALIFVGPILIKKIFGYASNEESWGVMYVLWMIGAGTHKLPYWFAVSKTFNAIFGRYIMLAFLLLIAWLSRRKKMTSLHACSLAACAWLVITPGFGVQYLLLPSILLLASHPRLGFYLSCMSGFFVGMVYFQNANHADLTTSRFYDLIQPPGTLAGLYTWGFMLVLIVILLRNRIGWLDPAPAT